MDKKLYSAISSGSYDYRNKFNEELFVKTVQQSLTYSISNSFTSYHNDYVFLNDSLDHLYEGGFKEDGTAYTPDNNVPNVGKYVLSNSYAQYKEDTYLPEVYRELLVEKYIKIKKLIHLVVLLDVKLIMLLSVKVKLTQKPLLT